MSIWLNGFLLGSLTTFFGGCGILFFLIKRAEGVPMRVVVGEFLSEAGQAIKNKPEVKKHSPIS